ncbi:hypothetical protein FBU30_007449 [Linnemannia zychae]|nr:hypothetical protein FBU30_007449 [Linnemannia zychae]
MIGEKRPTVMIIGAGLGGLMLGVLLHRASISFRIFEKSTSMKPTGSAIVIGSQILPLFAQLGLEKELLEIAQPVNELRVYNDKGELNFVTDFSDIEELTGYKEYTVARPALSNLLLSQIPPDRIHFGKRMMTKLEANDGIIVKMSDGSTFKSDILVGADGGYSTVRRCFFDRLKNEDKLSKEDRVSLPFRSIILAGQTIALDSYARDNLNIGDSLDEFNTTIIDKRPYTVMISTTSNNTITWTVTKHLNKIMSKEVEDQRLKNAENTGWGPYAIQNMCNETLGIMIPRKNGSTMLSLGDLIDLTPKELISRVLIEERVFDTWYAGRTILLGDAAHKINPCGGRAAMIAMHDAVTLANLIYTLSSTPCVQDLISIYQTYWHERHPVVLEELQNSQAISKVNERSLSGAIARLIAKNSPNRLWRQIFALHTRTQVQPLVAYLPTVEYTRSANPLMQTSYVMAREVFEQRRMAMQEPWLINK